MPFDLRFNMLAFLQISIEIFVFILFGFICWFRWERCFEGKKKIDKKNGVQQ